MQQALNQITIIKQNIVRRISLGLNLLALYPPDHPEVKAGMLLVMNHFTPYFLVEPEFVLGIESKGWAVQDVDLSKENIQFGASARELHRRGISAITFHKGITEEILLNFFQIATLSIETIDESGGLIEIVSNMRLPFINIFKLDYSKLLKTPSSPNASLFSDKVSYMHMIQEFENPDTTSKISQEDSLSCSEDLAILINQIYKSGNEENILSILDFISELGKHCVHKKQKENTDLKNSYQFLSQLNPALIQKLTHSLQHMKDSQSSINPAEVNDSYDPFQNRLLDLFNSFTSVNPDNKAILYQAKNEAKTLKELFGSTNDSSLTTSTSYKRFISESVQRTSDMLHSRDDTFSVHKEEILKAIHPDNIKKHTLNILLDLLELEKNPAVYFQLIRLLPAYFDFILTQMDIALIFRSFSFLDRHSVNKEDDLIRTCAQETIDSVFSGTVVFDLVECWLHSTLPDKTELLEKLLKRMNRSIVITQLRLLLFSLKDLNKKNKISKILPRLMQSDISQLKEDLNAKDPNIVKDAISIIKRISTEQCAHLLNELLKHSDPFVRNEALSALFSHGTQKSLEFLIPILPSLNKVNYSYAVNAFAKFGKKTVINQLKPLMSASDFFARTYNRRKDMISAFGYYKNNYAVLLLTETFACSPFLFKNKNNSFRAIILNNLARIGSDDAYLAIRLLSECSNTIIQLTGETLLEGKLSS